MRCILSILFFIIFFSGYSQSLPVADSTGWEPMAPLAKNPAARTPPARAPYPSYRKNIIKINLSSLILFNNYSFSVERSLTRKISAIVGYRFQPYNTIWSRSFIRNAAVNQGSLSDKTISDLDATLYSDKAFTGEFRFYTGKRAGARGFYVGLYGRYATFDIYAPVFNFYASNGILYKLPVHANANGLGGGIELGAQWWIARRVSINLSLLGGHYGRLGGNLTAEKDLSGLSDADKANLATAIDNNYIYANQQFVKGATVTNSGVSAKVSGPFVGTMMGTLNIGIVF